MALSCVLLACALAALRFDGLIAFPEERVMSLELLLVVTSVLCLVPGPTLTLLTSLNREHRGVWEGQWAQLQSPVLGVWPVILVCHVALASGVRAANTVGAGAGAVLAVQGAISGFWLVTLGGHEWLNSDDGYPPSIYPPSIYFSVPEVQPIVAFLGIRLAADLPYLLQTPLALVHRSAVYPVDYDFMQLLRIPFDSPVGPSYFFAASGISLLALLFRVCVCAWRTPNWKAVAFKLAYFLAAIAVLAVIWVRTQSVLPFPLHAFRTNPPYWPWQAQVSGWGPNGATTSFSIRLDAHRSGVSNSQISAFSQHTPFPLPLYDDSVAQRVSLNGTVPFLLDQSSSFCARVCCPQYLAERQGAAALLIATPGNDRKDDLFGNGKLFSGLGWDECSRCPKNGNCSFGPTKWPQPNLLLLSTPNSEFARLRRLTHDLHFNLTISAITRSYNYSMLHVCLPSLAFTVCPALFQSLMVFVSGLFAANLGYLA